MLTSIIKCSLEAFQYYLSDLNKTNEQDIHVETLINQVNEILYFLRYLISPYNSISDKEEKLLKMRSYKNRYSKYLNYALDKYNEASKQTLTEDEEVFFRKNINNILSFFVSIGDKINKNIKPIIQQEVDRYNLIWSLSTRIQKINLSLVSTDRDINISAFNELLILKPILISLERKLFNKNYIDEKTVNYVKSINNMFDSWELLLYNKKTEHTQAMPEIKSEKEPIPQPIHQEKKHIPEQQTPIIIKVNPRSNSNAETTTTELPIKKTCKIGKEIQLEEIPQEGVSLLTYLKKIWYKFVNFINSFLPNKKTSDKAKLNPIIKEKPAVVVVKEERIIDTEVAKQLEDMQYQLLKETVNRYQSSVIGLEPETFNKLSPAKTDRISNENVTIYASYFAKQKKPEKNQKTTEENQDAVSRYIASL